MCGIVGYTGRRAAAPILLEGLSRLEYRGYDSAGLAVRKGDGEIHIVRAQGRLSNLVEKTQNGSTLQGSCGIGHTRWATHGAPSEINAHPHYSEDKTVALVHNGILENYLEIKESLTKEGYAFYSQTDTEIAAKLLHSCFQKAKKNPVQAIRIFMQIARGSYAIAAIFREFPEEIYAIRKESPLLIGVGEGEIYLASDALAISKYVKKAYYMDNLEFACLTKNGVRFYNVEGMEIQKPQSEITWDASAAEKGAYPHFMLKEIFEQPQAIEKTLSYASEREKEEKGKLGLSENELKRIDQIYIAACGSSYHAGLAAQYVAESLAKLPVRVELASEFRYRNPVLTENTLVVVISQSGETADTLAALREAKRRGVKTFAVVNAVGSSIAREADAVFYTQAGAEIAVATTKAYSTQLLVGYLLGLELAKARGAITEKEYQTLFERLFELPEKVWAILDKKEELRIFSKRLTQAKDVFFIGRGIDYALSLEGSLKMKEISYIHSEAYAAGELKHGAISLIEKGVTAVSVLTQPKLFEKTLSNISEVKSRGGSVLAIAAEGNSLENVTDGCFYIPNTDALFSASLAVIPLQLLAYFVSVQKGLDVDKPRNLAKSVTVE